MHLKNLHFKKYLGWFVKFPDKNNQNPDNYLPIWNCTSSCGEQKAHKCWKYLQVFNLNFEERQRNLSVVFGCCLIPAHWKEKAAQEQWESLLQLHSSWLDSPCLCCSSSSSCSSNSSPSTSWLPVFVIFVRNWCCKILYWLYSQIW